MVGFYHRPHTREVIRDAWRLSHGLHAELLAITIQPEGYLAFRSKLVRLLKYRGGKATPGSRTAAPRRACTTREGYSGHR